MPDTHGGKREGAGRPPLPAGERKAMRSFKLSPDIIEFLTSCDNATEQIENTLRRSHAFRQWRKTRKATR